MMSILVSKSVLFTSEAATLLSLSVQRVYGLIHSCKLPAYKEKDCRAWKIPAESVTNYIKRIAICRTIDKPRKHLSSDDRAAVWAS